MGNVRQGGRGMGSGGREVGSGSVTRLLVGGGQECPRSRGGYGRVRRKEAMAATCSSLIPSATGGMTERPVM